MFHVHPSRLSPHPEDCSFCLRSVASNMCASARYVIIPTPPHPTPPREKHPVCVSSNMCASARYVIIPTPPHPTPRETSCLRIIKHVFKWKKHHQSKNRRTSRGRWVGVYPTTTTTTTTAATATTTKITRTTTATTTTSHCLKVTLPKTNISPTGPGRVLALLSWWFSGWNPPNC